MNHDRKWAALAVLAAGLSLIVLDGTIVGVALPAIIADLRLDLTDAQWVNSLYSVVFAALLLTFGRLGDRFGRRSLFLAGVTVFVAGSVVAAFASGAEQLIASRALQGVGGALVLPSTLSTVNATFRGRDRAVAFGVWGAVMAGMAAIGPLLGGVLTTWLDWRWIFLVNVPLGIAVVAAGVAWVPESRGRIDAPGADVLGLLLSAGGLGLLVFGLIEGNSLGWWTPTADFPLLGFVWGQDAPVSLPAAAIGVGIVLVGLFLGWEGRRGFFGRSALLDLRLFRIGTFAWGNLTAGMVAVAEFALVLVVPLFLVNVLGLDIMGAGLVLAAMAFGAFLSGAMARHVAARFGAPRVVTLGLALEVAGVAVTALALSRTTSPWLLAITLAVYGLGLGLASAQLTSTVLADVPTAQSGAASATQSTVRQLGSAFGSAIGGTALAVSLHATLPAHLAEFGLTGRAASGLVDATVLWAGSNIPGLVAAGAHGRFGDRTPQLAAALADGFARATSSALWIAAAFLALGLIGSLVVSAQANRQAAARASDDSQQPTDVSGAAPSRR